MKGLCGQAARGGVAIRLNRRSEAVRTTPAGRRSFIVAVAVILGAALLPASGLAAVGGITIPPPPLLQPPTFTPPSVPSLGEVVVFAAGVDLNPVDGGERGGITIARADGTGLRKVTNFETRGYELSKIHGINFPDDHPSFSPDGMRIVFASNRADEEITHRLCGDRRSTAGMHPFGGRRRGPRTSVEVGFGGLHR